MCCTVGLAEFGAAVRGAAGGSLMVRGHKYNVTLSNNPGVCGSWHVYCFSLEL
jgi:hypothetical protein